MKNLFLGFAFIVLVGFGGFFYRNAVEYSSRPIACPVDTLTCPDGTELTHIGLSCSFPACPPPNVSLADIGIAFALPAGATSVPLPDATSVAAYATPSMSPAENGSIIIRRFMINASSTALATIQETALGGTSGEPVSPVSFSSAMLGTHRYTVVKIDRFEGVVDTAYYLARRDDVLRFDAIDRGVDWTNPNLDISTLPTHEALRALLATLQGE